MVATVDIVTHRPHITSDSCVCRSRCPVFAMNLRAIWDSGTPGRDEWLLALGHLDLAATVDAPPPRLRVVQGDPVQRGVRTGPVWLPQTGPVVGGANSSVARVRVQHVNVHRTLGWLEHLLELSLQVVACPLAVGPDLDRQLHVALLEPLVAHDR